MPTRLIHFRSSHVTSAAGTLKNSGFSSEVLLKNLGWRGRSTTPPSTPFFGIIYEGALADLLELDLVIYEIIYEREKREVYYFYVRNFPGGTVIPVRADRCDMAEGPSSDNDEDKDDKDNDDDDDDNDCDDDSDGGGGSKSTDIIKKVGDKA